LNYIRRLRVTSRVNASPSPSRVAHLRTLSLPLARTDRRAAHPVVTVPLDRSNPFSNAREDFPRSRTRRGSRLKKSRSRRENLRPPSFPPHVSAPPGENEATRVVWANSSRALCVGPLKGAFFSIFLHRAYIIYNTEKIPYKVHHEYEYERPHNPLARAPPAAERHNRTLISRSCLPSPKPPRKSRRPSPSPPARSPTPSP